MSGCLGRGSRKIPWCWTPLSLSRWPQNLASLLYLVNITIRAGSHFDISISINISITKICVNRDYISISVRMAIAPAQFTSRESKIQ